MYVVKILITKNKRFNFHLSLCSDGGPYISVLQGYELLLLVDNIGNGNFIGAVM